MNPGAAVGLGLALACAGYAAGWLAFDGTLAAAAVGGTVLAGAGWPGGVMLALFFLSGSALTASTERRGLAHPDAKGGRRDARQVLANGLWAAIGAAMVLKNGWPGWAVLTGALAAAQSDTWATELGARARAAPRLITTGNVVARGTSGGVTVLGTLGGLAGAAALVAVGLAAGAPWRAAAAGLAGGVVGMTADSVLGATLQARFRCEACGEATERPRHRCGGPTRLASGWRWLDNDTVNLLATGAGGSTAALLSSWF